MIKPLISVIIPVYNVEQYLAKTLDSVISQDINFHSNIEIILVNDGSVDESLSICKRYAHKYPDNIYIIDQSNSGVSTARNRGLDKARGTYVHFLDSDDVISKGAYRAAVALLNANKNVDFAALKIEFFDGQHGEHPLNYKFTSSDRVVSVDEEPDALILHMATCVMRRKSLKHRFDPKIQISEDMKFLSDLLISKRSYGLIGSQKYYYRKRRGGGSAIDGSAKNKTYYTVTPKKVYQQILKDWGGHKHAQYVVMYDLQWRLRQQKQEVLTEKQQERYIAIITSLLSTIEDSIILEQRYMSRALVEYALRLKHRNVIDDKLASLIKSKKVTAAPEVALHIMELGVDELTLEFATINDCSFDKVYIDIDGSCLSPEPKDNIHVLKKFLGHPVPGNAFYTVTIPLGESSKNIKFVDEKGVALKIIPKRFSRIQDLNGGYVSNGRYIVKNAVYTLNVVPESVSQHLRAELKLLMRILVAVRLKGSLKKLYGLIKSTRRLKQDYIDAVKYILTPPYVFLKNCKTIFYRLSYYVFRWVRSGGRPLWIISDLAVAAGDNGEAFFRYVVDSKKNDAEYYFAISNKSKDYTRLKKEFGSLIIKNNGLMYRIRFLAADKIISAHADETVLNPFNDRVKYLNDLYTFDFVFLQHGVIHTDISKWLNKYNKNIKLFVVSAQQEYDSILEYPYYYKEENILPSGLPRYDLLSNTPKNKLVLAPTWRHHLASEIDPATGERAYSPVFKKTEYFKFYSNFMKDSRLLKALADHGMKGELYLHPAFRSQVRDFNENEIFSVKEFPYDYKAAFSEGSLLVTDYSSVIFDFSYLGKPIMYTQFDKDTFFKQHMYTEGYMDDERDGFGPVSKTLDQAVDDAIEIIESGCKRKDLYSHRVDTFFLHNDRRNSARVYEAIMKISGV